MLAENWLTSIVATPSMTNGSVAASASTSALRPRQMMIPPVRGSRRPQTTIRSSANSCRSQAPCAGISASTCSIGAQ
jgi:hypothetical protein